MPVINCNVSFIRFWITVLINGTLCIPCEDRVDTRSQHESLADWTLVVEHFHLLYPKQEYEMTFTLQRVAMRTPEGCGYSLVNFFPATVSGTCYKIKQHSFRKYLNKKLVDNLIKYYLYLFLVTMAVSVKHINLETLLTAYLCACRANRSTNQSTRQSPSLDLSSVCAPLLPISPFAPASQSAFGQRFDETYISSVETKLLRPSYFSAYF